MRPRRPWSASRARRGRRGYRDARRCAHTVAHCTVDPPRHRTRRSAWMSSSCSRSGRVPYPPYKPMYNLPGGARRAAETLEGGESRGNDLKSKQGRSRVAASAEYRAVADRHRARKVLPPRLLRHSESRSCAFKKGFHVCCRVRSDVMARPSGLMANMVSSSTSFHANQSAVRKAEGGRQWCGWRIIFSAMS
jgi:hypothetical protein